MLLSDLDVHREQMGSDARYFRRDSAEELADLLQSVPPYNGTARELALDAVHRSAANRMVGFTEDFVRLVQDTAAKGRV